jgi:ferrochelatase
MSFHGIPERYAVQGDPYPAYCRETAEAVAARLGLDDSQWTLSFQSRFGREPWLQPYTDVTLEEWGASGPRRVDVLCPGFAVDCLETLEEIDIRNRETYVDAGGEDYRYIPALNDSDAHVALCEELVREATLGWEPDRS